MSTGMGLTTAGTAVRAAGVDGQFGTNLLGAWGTYFQGKLSAEMQRLSAWRTAEQAKDNLEDAESYMNTAGKIQQSGDDQTRNRYLQLGQDVGRIYAGASGSGIDVSSATVRHVDRSARIMANSDVTAINRSTADAANAYVARAKSARLNYVNQLEQATMMGIQADYTQKIARSNARSAAFSAVGQWMGGHAANASSFFGG